jgi:hypothetical protein
LSQKKIGEIPVVINEVKLWYLHFYFSSRDIGLNVMVNSEPQ